ncbi:MAG: VanZ family protein [Gammaproteobacteria bacterium]
MRWFWRLSFWSALLAVTLASLAPVTHLPPQTFDIWDKAQHAAGFALLTLLCLPAFDVSRTRVFLGLALYGAAIETAQQISGWRTGDPMDWMADITGILAATALHAAFTLIRRATTKQVPAASSDAQ